MISYMPGIALGAEDPKANTMNMILALRNLWPSSEGRFCYEKGSPGYFMSQIQETNPVWKVKKEFLCK